MAARKVPATRRTVTRGTHACSTPPPSPLRWPGTLVALWSLFPRTGSTRSVDATVAALLATVGDAPAPPSPAAPSTPTSLNASSAAGSSVASPSDRTQSFQASKEAMISEARRYGGSLQRFPAMAAQRRWRVAPVPHLCRTCAAPFSGRHGRCCDVYRARHLCCFRAVFAFAHDCACALSCDGPVCPRPCPHALPPRNRAGCISQSMGPRFLN